MRLAEKLQAFNKSGLAFRTIGVQALGELGVAPANRFSRHLLFEKGCKIGSPVYVRASEAPSFLGAHSYMNDGGYMRGGVFVGRYCSIGRRVSLGAGSHSMTGLSTSPRISSIRSESPPYTDEELQHLKKQNQRDPHTVLCSDVWVGDGAVILPGVIVGPGCVIGANAVVTRDLPPYSIAAGMPAKIVGQRFSDEVASDLVASEWWEIDLAELQRMPVKNVFAFLESLANVEPRRATCPTYKLG